MDNGSDRPSRTAPPDTTDAARKLVEAQAQIDELVELNKRLRSELGEMTVMWVGALGGSIRPVRAVRQAVAKLRKAFGGPAPAPVQPFQRSVRDYQMLGALSALHQGRHAGLVIPAVELLALGYAMEVDGRIWISPEGEDVLKGLRATLLNTGQHPVVMR